jgi:hypothetical protein
MTAQIPSPRAPDPREPEDDRAGQAPARGRGTKGDSGLAGAGDRAGIPSLVGRKSVLMGMAASMGFVLGKATEPPAVTAKKTTQVQEWAPATAYALGQQIISPTNDVVSAKVAHTSSAAYATDQVNWTLSSTFGRAWKVSDAGIFVSPLGNDALNDGLSPGGAKRTIAAAVAALPAAGGTVTLGAGGYLDGAVLRSGVHIAAMPGAVLETSGANDAFTVPADRTANDVQFSGGLSINTPNRAFRIGGTLALSTLTVTIWQQSGSTPAIEATGMIDTKWLLNITGTPGGTAPLVKLIAGPGNGINANSFTGRATHSGSVIFHIEDPSGSSYASNNSIRDFTFEIANAGIVRILSGYLNILENVGIWDMSAASTGHMVYLGKSSTSIMQTLGTRIAGMCRAGGTLGSGFVDIKCEAGESSGTDVSASNATNGDGLVIDWGGGHGCYRGRGYPLARSNDAYVTGSTDTGGHQLPREAKGNWRPADAVGQGRSIYDPLTHRPIYSDGTNWRDAMGKIIA